MIGYIEVDMLQEGQRLTRHGGWADVGNLCVAADHRRRGVATWLLGQAARWLELGHVDRLLDYTSLDDPAQPDGTGYRMLLAASASRSSPGPSAPGPASHSTTEHRRAPGHQRRNARRDSLASASVSMLGWKQAARTARDPSG